jgi:hypothetical protein
MRTRASAGTKDDGGGWPWDRIRARSRTASARAPAVPARGIPRDARLPAFHCGSHCLAGGSLGGWSQHRAAISGIVTRAFRRAPLRREQVRRAGRPKFRHVGRRQARLALFACILIGLSGSAARCPGPRARVSFSLIGSVDAVANVDTASYLFHVNRPRSLAGVTVPSVGSVRNTRCRRPSPEAPLADVVAGGRRARLRGTRDGPTCLRAPSRGR